MDEMVFGERELDVIGVLWAMGSGTVAEVRDQLPVPLAYTTVLTILRNLEDKGFVSHEAEGRAHRYFPRVAKKDARTTLVGRLVDKLFHGSAEQLLVHLVQDRKLTTDDLERIRRTLRSGETSRRRATRRTHKRGEP
jgi:BlaI family transcriptional regulator, penicillinase repressor